MVLKWSLEAYIPENNIMNWLHSRLSTFVRLSEVRINEIYQLFFKSICIVFSYWEIVINASNAWEISVNTASHLAFTCSKLIETLEQRCEFGGFIVNFEDISHLCFSVPNVNCEHVISGWVLFAPLHQGFCAIFLPLLKGIAVY